MLTSTRLAWVAFLANGTLMVAVLWRRAFGAPTAPWLDVFTLGTLLLGFVSSAVTITVSLRSPERPVRTFTDFDDALALFPAEDDPDDSDDEPVKLH